MSFFELFKKDYFNYVLLLGFFSAGITRLLNYDILKKEEEADKEIFNNFTYVLIILFELSSIYFLHINRDYTKLYLITYFICNSIAISRYFSMRKKNIMDVLKEVVPFTHNELSIGFHIFLLIVIFYLIVI